MKIALLLVVVLNFGVLCAGFVTWMDSYNPARQMFAGVLLLTPLLNLYLIVWEFRSKERRLDKRVRIARLEHELKQLGQ